MMKKDKKAMKITAYSSMEEPMNPSGQFFADPQGSYTGRPIIPEELPVQDADDL